MSAPSGERESPRPPPTLSLCLIARDAEFTLGRALESARPFVDEMVVVDTGSTDRTREIAGSLGARVETFPWRDDFSAARNASLDAARGLWIFWMDADDVLPPGSGALLHRAIEAHPERDAAFWVAVEQSREIPSAASRTTRHDHVKLFPNHPGIRFRYRVHEQVLPAIRGLGLPVKNSGAVVRHERAAPGPEDQERRLTRNRRLLELELADHPNDSGIKLNLGLTLQHWPESRPRAIALLREALVSLSRNSTARLNAWLILADALGRDGGDSQEGLAQVLDEALAEYPDDANVLCRRAEVAERLGDASRAMAHYRRALERGTLRLGSVHVPDLPVRAALRLGALELAAGRPDAAHAVWSTALARHPDDRLREALAELALRPFVKIAR